MSLVSTNCKRSPNDSPVCRRREVGASSIPGWRRHTGPLDETAAPDRRADSSSAATPLADSIRQALASPPTLPAPLASSAGLSLRQRKPTMAKNAQKRCRGTDGRKGRKGTAKESPHPNPRASFRSPDLLTETPPVQGTFGPLPFDGMASFTPMPRALPFALLVEPAARPPAGRWPGQSSRRRPAPRDRPGTSSALPPGTSCLG